MMIRENPKRAAIASVASSLPAAAGPGGEDEYFKLGEWDRKNKMLLTLKQRQNVHINDCDEINRVHSQFGDMRQKARFKA
ncbi:MAG: hypothetical protein LBH04_07475 [Tannerellaceae bacterium]|jgi:hypothetical protein|nr:hypothetical protein [Tannerellaceae bacterium]